MHSWPSNKAGDEKGKEPKGGNERKQGKLKKRGKREGNKQIQEIF